MTDTTSMEGIIIKNLNIIYDQRGAILHMLRSDSEGYSNFGEIYFSEINVGFIKGWKSHTEQTQNIVVPIGLVKFVLFDDRNNSSTKGNILSIEIGRPKNYKLLIIPPKIWYSFKCIGNNEALIANCADLPHNKKEAKTLPLNDDQIPYKWD